MKNNSFDYEIGETLKEIRVTKGLSVVQVQQLLRSAYQIEISDKTIYSWEKNRSHPSIPVFLMLCQIYDIQNIRVFLKSQNETEQEFYLTNEDREIIRRYHNSRRRAKKEIQEILEIPWALRSI